MTPWLAHAVTITCQSPTKHDYKTTETVYWISITGTVRQYSIIQLQQLTDTS